MFVIFLVSGFWHGANWTFIIWGGIHALLFIPSFVLGTDRNHLEEKKVKDSKVLIIDLFKILYTFSMVSFAWIFFRSNSLRDAYGYIIRINSFNVDDFSLIMVSDYILILALLILDYCRLKNIKFHMLLWLIMIIAIIGSMNRMASAEFIYFQF